MTSKEALKDIYNRNEALKKEKHYEEKLNAYIAKRNEEFSLSWHTKLRYS